MRKLCLGIASLLAITGLVLLAPKPSVSAADDTGFNIVTSPLPIKITTPPGKTITTKLRVKNQGLSDETIKVGLMKFGATGTTGQPNLFDLSAQDTYAKWVTFSPNQFKAPPGVWIETTMTIKVPPEASLGYYLAVTFSRAAQAGQPDTTAVKGSAAELVLLDVKTANEQRNLNLVDFSSDHGLYEYLPATFKIKVRNKGNIYLAPTGNIFITKGGKAISTLDFNTVGGSVLPGSNRIYSLPWEDGFPVFKERLVNGKPVNDSHAVPKKDLHWDFTQASKLRFGKYTANLLVVYNDGTRDVPLQSSLTFWVLPWKLMLLGVVIIGLVGFSIFSLLRGAARKAKGSVAKRRKTE